MTRDGLVEVNQSTGEQERISLRGQEFQLRQSESTPEAMPLREQPHTGVPASKRDRWIFSKSQPALTSGMTPRLLVPVLTQHPPTAYPYNPAMPR